MSENKKIDSVALAQIFTEARTHNAYLDRPVPEALLREAVDIAKLGPTSANQSPLRVLFLHSKEAKERLRPTLMEGNLAKTMAAPVVALTAYDTKFFEHAPYLMPHFDVRPWFEGNEAFATRTAFQNGTLQVAYLIVALRAVGLDTGPMTGFDTAKADAEFFPDGRFKSNVLINIGYGDRDKLFPRSPRFSFDEIAKVI